MPDTWNPGVAGQVVCLRDNPGRRGITTGRTKQAGSFVMVEVDFGPNEKQYKRFDSLEPAGEADDPIDLLKLGRYGDPTDLRRCLTFEKVKGDLTNVFYSMESSNTEFYPHQFKPVLKFIESPVGRLLIADEVGLGKTIEAIYIWKELQARHDARRLLVVCPAMLREKWKGDLKNRFNLAADVVRAQDLVGKVVDTLAGDPNNAFVCIASLEALRPPSSLDDDADQSPTARFARLLDQNTATEEFSLFDLVVIDEAHYLRNSETASNHLGRLLRDASRHMVVLTATPIQIHSENLFQILRLVDPDQFYDARVFADMLAANGPVVRAQRALWRIPADLRQAVESLEAAQSNIYFENDTVLQRIRGELTNFTGESAERIEIARLLEARSLLGQYMTRSRKREVLPNRVERAAQVLNVTFSAAEAAIYRRISQYIREQSRGQSGARLFALIARQRQMASSLVAALSAWSETGLVSEVLWEDLGTSPILENTIPAELPVAGDPAGFVPYAIAEEVAGVDLGALEAQDTKYTRLREFLREQLARNPREKFVVFAYFRATLGYLSRRLQSDGIRGTLMMGGMGDQKDHILAEFAKDDGPSVLLSSEVGSEGIDLQFCRFLVNYDLPWNPMRVEQRIGRLDRLGQKAERISIINLAVQDTIEDRVLIRLYDRIKLFEESIGDLEEILGEQTEKLLVELLDPHLSEQERDRRAAQAELAIINQRAEQERLEAEAVNLVGFSDFIISTINDSRAKGRWLSGEELLSLVEDFFARKYPGTQLERSGGEMDSVLVRLSDQARTDLGMFIMDTKPVGRTRLHQSARPVTCIFEPRRGPSLAREQELIDATHPLIQWIRAFYLKEGKELYPVSAIRLEADNAPVPAGDYVFVTQRWSLVGLRTDHQLVFAACKPEGGQLLDESTAEALVTTASREGKALPNAVNLLGSSDAIHGACFKCMEHLLASFGERLKDFEAENTLRCSQQEVSARSFSGRRIVELEQRLQRYVVEGRARLIPMTEGLLNKEKEHLRTKLARIERSRNTDATFADLAVGVIRVH